jgi:hypothetical protein
LKGRTNGKAKKNFEEVLCKTGYGMLVGILYAILFWDTGEDSTGGGCAGFKPCGNDYCYAT